MASPWLIERFIDPEAEFQFLPRDQADQIPEDAIPLAFPGVELGPHDDEGPLFLKILRKYKLDDPALDVIAEVVEKGGAFVVHDYDPPIDDWDGQMGVGLVAVADGISLVEPSDRRRLDRSYVVWDAVYAVFSEGREWRRGA